MVQLLLLRIIQTATNCRNSLNEKKNKPEPKNIKNDNKNDSDDLYIPTNKLRNKIKPLKIKMLFGAKSKKSPIAYKNTKAGSNIEPVPF